MVFLIFYTQNVLNQKITETERISEMWTRKLVAWFVFSVLLGIYGGGFLINHETTFSEEETVVSRMNLTPLSYTEFAVNLSNGNEEIDIYGGLFSTSWFIDYDGVCECITKVHKMEGLGNTVSFVNRDYANDEKVYFSSGKTVVRILSSKEAQPYFDEGTQIRDAVRERFSEYLSSEK